MPNKRARNKVFFGGFVDRRVKASLTRAAGAAGMRDNVFGFAMAELQDRLLRTTRSRSKRRYLGNAQERPAAQRRSRAVRAGSRAR